MLAVLLSSFCSYISDRLLDYLSYIIHQIFTLLNLTLMALFVPNSQKSYSI